MKRTQGDLLGKGKGDKIGSRRRKGTNEMLRWEAVMQQDSDHYQCEKHFIEFLTSEHGIYPWTMHRIIKLLSFTLYKFR